ncbi:MAG: hypothetical protein AAF206_18010, partial [Bacteroidota bacterium]
PFSRGRRLLGYVICGVFIYTPDLLLCLFFLPDVSGVEISLALLALHQAGFLLGIGAMHYRPVELGDFLKWVYGFFFFGFFWIISGFSPFFYALLVAAFGSWIFWLEYNRWDGFQT